MDTKACTGCRKVKRIDQFNKHKRSKDGLATRCKSCCARYDKEVRQRNSPKKRAAWAEAIFKGLGLDDSEY